MKVKNNMLGPANIPTLAPSKAKKLPWRPKKDAAVDTSTGSIYYFDEESNEIKEIKSQEPLYIPGLGYGSIGSIEQCLNKTDDLTDVAWTETVNGDGTITVTGNQPDPFGGNNAFRIQASLNGGADSTHRATLKQTISGLTASTNYCPFCWIKNNGGSNQVILDLYDYSVVTISDDWDKYEKVTNEAQTSMSFRIGIRGSYVNDDIDILVFMPQVYKASNALWPLCSATPVVTLDRAGTTSFPFSPSYQKKPNGVEKVANNAFKDGLDNWENPLYGGEQNATLSIENGVLRLTDTGGGLNDWRSKFAKQAITYTENSWNHVRIRLRASEALADNVFLRKDFSTSANTIREDLSLTTDWLDISELFFADEVDGDISFGCVDWHGVATNQYIECEVVSVQECIDVLASDSQKVFDIIDGKCKDENLVTNGSCDILPTMNGQVLSNYLSTHEISNEQAHSHTSSIKVTMTSAVSAPSLVRFLTGSDCGLKSGKRYERGAWVYNPSTSNIPAMELRTRNNAGAETIHESTSLKDQWVFLSCREEDDNGQRILEIRATSADQNDFFYVDDLYVKEVLPSQGRIKFEFTPCFNSDDLPNSTYIGILSPKAGTAIMAYFAKSIGNFSIRFHSEDGSTYSVTGTNVEAFKTYEFEADFGFKIDSDAVKKIIRIREKGTSVWESGQLTDFSGVWDTTNEFYIGWSNPYGVFVNNLEVFPIESISGWGMYPTEHNLKFETTKDIEAFLDKVGGSYERSSVIRVMCDDENFHEISTDTPAIWGGNFSADGEPDIPRIWAVHAGTPIISGDYIEFGTAVCTVSISNFWEIGSTYEVCVICHEYTGDTDKVVPPYDGTNVKDIYEEDIKISSPGTYTYEYKPENSRVFMYSFADSSSAIEVVSIKKCVFQNIVPIEEKPDIPRSFSIELGSPIINGNEITFADEAAMVEHDAYWDIGKTYIVDVTISDYEGTGNIVLPYSNGWPSIGSVGGNGHFKYTYLVDNNDRMRIYSYPGHTCKLTINSIKKASIFDFIGLASWDTFTNAANVNHYRDFSNVTGNRGGLAIASQNQKGIDGKINTAWTIEDLSSTSSDLNTFFSSIPDDNNWVSCSIFLRKDKAFTAYPMLDFYVYGGITPLRERVIIDPFTGEITYRQITDGETTIIDLGAWFYINQGVINNASGNVNLGFYVYPSGSSDGLNIDESATGKVVVDWLQKGEGQRYCPIFPVVGGETLDSGDFNFPDSFKMVSNSKGFININAQMMPTWEPRDSYDRIFEIGSGCTVYLNSDKDALRFRDSVAADSAQVASLTNQKQRNILGYWDESDWELIVDGIKQTTARASSMTPSTFYLGSTLSVSRFFPGIIKTLDIGYLLEKTASERDLLGIQDFDLDVVFDAPLTENLQDNISGAVASFERASILYYDDEENHVGVDVPHFNEDGLLHLGEGGNMLPYSEDITQAHVNDSIIVDPCIFQAGESGDRFYFTIWTEDSTLYTFSIFCKVEGDRTTDLNIEYYNSESGAREAFTPTEEYAWHSVTVLGRAGGGSVSFGVRDTGAENFPILHIAKMQLEKGTVRTPYMPTNGTPFVRASQATTGNQGVQWNYNDLDPRMLACLSDKGSLLVQYKPIGTLSVGGVGIVSVAKSALNILYTGGPDATSSYDATSGISRAGSRKIDQTTYYLLTWDGGASEVKLSFSIDGSSWDTSTAAFDGAFAIGDVLNVFFNYEDPASIKNLRFLDRVVGTDYADNFFFNNLNISMALDITSKSKWIDSTDYTELSGTITHSEKWVVGAVEFSLNNAPFITCDTISGNDFTHSSMTLVEGSNTITVRATDNLGNTALETYHVMVDTAAPTLDLGLDIAYPGDTYPGFTLESSLISEINPKEISYAIDGGKKVTWDLSDAKDILFFNDKQDHSLAVTVSDFVGNEITDTVNIAYEEPTITPVSLTSTKEILEFAEAHGGTFERAGVLRVVDKDGRFWDSGEDEPAIWGGIFNAEGNNAITLPDLSFNTGTPIIDGNTVIFSAGEVQFVTLTDCVKAYHPYVISVTVEDMAESSVILPYDGGGATSFSSRDINGNSIRILDSGTYEYSYVSASTSLHIYSYIENACKVTVNSIIPYSWKYHPKCGMACCPSMTNALPIDKYRDFSLWAGTALEAQDQIGIDGRSNKATTLTDSDNLNYQGRAVSFTVSDDDSWHCMLIHVLKDSDETRFPGLYLELLGGSIHVLERVVLNTNTGTYSEFVDNGEVSIIDTGIFWQIPIAVRNNSTGNTTLTITVYPSISQDGTNPDPTVTGSIVTDWIQVFLNCRIPSPFPIVGGSTLAPQSFSFNSEGLIHRQQGSIFAEFKMLPDDRNIETSMIVGNNQYTMYVYSNADNRLGIFDGDEIVVHNSAIMRNTKAMTHWGPDGIFVVANSHNAEAPDPYNNSFTEAVTAIGARANGSNAFNGIISNVEFHYMIQQTIDYMQEKTTPEITIKLNSDDEEWVTSETYSDFGGTVEIDSTVITGVQIKINDGTYTDVDNFSDGVWSHNSLSLDEGSNTITVNVTSTRTSKEKSVIINVSTTAPSIDLGSNKEYSKIYGFQTITLHSGMFSCDNVSEVSISVDSGEFRNWEAPYNHRRIPVAADGNDHTVTLKVIDKHGREATDTLNILYVNTPINSLHIEPLHGQWVSDEAFTLFSGTFTTKTGEFESVSVRQNDGEWVSADTVNYPNWSHNSFTLIEGTNILSVKVTTDSETFQKHIRVNSDFTEPVIDLGWDELFSEDKPISSFTIGNSMVTEKNIESIRYKLDDNDWVACDKKFNGVTVPVPYNAIDSSLTLDVTDVVGNNVQETINFKYSDSLLVVGEEMLNDVSAEEISFIDAETGELVTVPSETPLVIDDYFWSIGQIQVLNTYANDFTKWSKRYGNFGGLGIEPIVTPEYERLLGTGVWATRLQCDLDGGVTTSDSSYIDRSITLGDTSLLSIWAKTNDGETYRVSLDIGGNSGFVTVTPTWQRLSRYEVTTGISQFRIGLRGGFGYPDTCDISIAMANAVLSKTWLVPEQLTTAAAITTATRAGTISTPIGGKNVTAENYGIVINEELIEGGDCSVDSFNKGSGWSYDPENKRYNAVATSGNLTKSIPIEQGDRAEIKVKIEDYVSGTLYVDLGDSGDFATFTANGDYTLQLNKVGVTEPVIRFYGGAVTCSVTDISAKKVVVNSSVVNAANKLLDAVEGKCGDELFVDSNFELGVSGWTPYTNNIISHENQTVKITFVDDADAGYCYLIPPYTSEDIFVGERLYLEVKISINTGTALLRVYDGTTYQTIGTITTESQVLKYYLDYVGPSTAPILRIYGLEAGQEVTIESQSAKKVSQAYAYWKIPFKVPFSPDDLSNDTSVNVYSLTDTGYPLYIRKTVGGGTFLSLYDGVNAAGIAFTWQANVEYIAEVIYGFHIESGIYKMQLKVYQGNDIIGESDIVDFADRLPHAELLKIGYGATQGMAVAPFTIASRLPDGWGEFPATHTLDMTATATILEWCETYNATLTRPSVIRVVDKNGRFWDTPADKPAIWKGEYSATGNDDIGDRSFTVYSGSPIIDGDTITFTEGEAQAVKISNYWVANQPSLVSVSVTDHNGSGSLIPPYNGMGAGSVDVDNIDISISENGDFEYTYNTIHLNLYIYSDADNAATITVNSIIPYTWKYALGCGMAHWPSVTNSMPVDKYRDISAWNLVQCNYVQNQKGIDGKVNTAWILTDDNDVDHEICYVATAVSDDGNWQSCSCYIKKEDDESSFPLIFARLSGGTTEVRQSIIFSKKTGNFSVQQDNDGEAVIVDCGTFWFINVSVQNNTSGNTLFRLYVYPAGSKNGTTSDSTATGSCVFDWGGFYLNQRCSCPFPVIGGSTLSAHTFSFPNNMLLADLKGAIYAEYQTLPGYPETLVDNSRILDNTLLYLNNSFPALTFDNTNVVYTGSKEDTAFKTVVSWDGEVQKIICNGDSATGSYDGSISVTSELFIGAKNGGTNVFPGIISKLEFHYLLPGKLEDWEDYTS